MEYLPTKHPDMRMIIAGSSLAHVFFVSARKHACQPLADVAPSAELTFVKVHITIPIRNE